MFQPEERSIYVGKITRILLIAIGVKKGESAKGAVNVVEGWNTFTPSFLPIPFKRPLPINAMVAVYIYMASIAF